MSSYAAALAATLLVETLVALALAPEGRRALLVVLPLANLVTHPLATLALAEACAPLAAVEVAVTVLEAALYRVALVLDLSRAVLVSVAANGATTAILLLVRG